MVKKEKTKPTKAEETGTVNITGATVIGAKVKPKEKPAEKKTPHCPTCKADIDVKRAKGGYTCACGTYLRGFE